jgi:hypothetical protein
MAPFLLHDLDSSVPTKVHLFSIHVSAASFMKEELISVLPPTLTSTETTFELTSRPIKADYWEMAKTSSRHG